MTERNIDDNDKPGFAEDYEKLGQENNSSNVKRNTDSEITDDEECILVYFGKNCDTFPMFAEVEYTGSEISYDKKFDYIISPIKKDKIEKMAEKLGCKVHKKKFGFYCQNCERNLCEECNKLHQCPNDSKSKKIVSFKELNKENEKKEKYIDEYISDNKEENIRNQNEHTILKREEIKNISSLYKAVICSKNYFPNYSHFFNIEKIYFYLLDKIEIKYCTKNDQNSQKIRLFGKKFVENNRKNCTLIIDGKMTELCEHYEIKNQELKELKITLIKKSAIESMKDMFKNCNCLTSVIKKQWRQKKVIDMSYMFCRCEKLNKVNLFSEIDVSEVTDFSYMFNKCKSLQEIEPLYFNTSKAKKLNYMFNGCEKLEKIDGILEYKTDNVEEMSGMFNNCKKLKNLIKIENKIDNKMDLSKWNFSKVKDISNLFRDCESLETIIMNENKSEDGNLTNMEYMFANCKNLKKIDGLSNWNTKNVKKMNHMFNGCSNLKELSDISSWNIDNVEDSFNDMFDEDCSKDIIPSWYNELIN